MTGSGGVDTQAPRPKIAAMERGPGPSRYALPSLTGREGHSPTKKIFPAYSFGRKVGGGFIAPDCSPGPVHNVDPSFTRYGREGVPSYSLYARHKELTAFKTPGPGAYRPEQSQTCFQGEKKMPAYSMAARTRYRKRDANPSPNTYTLPTLLGERVPYKPSSACYSMAKRLKAGDFAADYAKTPGPARYDSVSAELTQPRRPSYSIQARQFMPGDPTQKPGPGAHCPERCNVTKRQAPAYSLGIRHSEFVCPLIIEVSD
ncbi:Outer dense fiber protein 3 [Geodia barretti]|uniref:Outer dense fiber protein 3 n=1 Tax=Geodia barretti TaxID=519541 RepID=A0AA35R5W8_GEOBA|nr:Outer dense fiber protein 3 [Geodia barretti]